MTVLLSISKCANEERMSTSQVALLIALPLLPKEPIKSHLFPAPPTLHSHHPHYLLSRPDPFSFLGAFALELRAKNTALQLILHISEVIDSFQSWLDGSQLSAILIGDMI